MKKTSIILTLAAMLVAMVSCTKEEQPVSGKFTMTVNADKGSRATKDLSLSGTTLNATWKAGEEVKVYKDETLLGTLTAASDGSTTTLSGSITVPDGVTIAENDVLTLKFLSDDYDEQDGTLAYIAEHCDYAVATVTISGISGSSVSTTDAVFENQQAIVKFTLQKSDHSALPSNPTALTVDYGTGSVTLSSIPATYTTNEGNGVLYVAIPGFEDETVTLTATVGDATYTKAVSGITFANGQYYTITAGLTGSITWTSSDISGIHLSPYASTTIKGITAASTSRSVTWNDSIIESPGQAGVLTFSSTYTFYKIEITCSQPSSTPAGWNYSDGKLVWNGTPATSVTMLVYNQISGITRIDFTVQ